MFVNSDFNVYSLLTNVCHIRYWQTFVNSAFHKLYILVALHFSMQNIYQSCDQGHAVGRSDINVSQ